MIDDLFSIGSFFNSTSGSYMIHDDDEYDDHDDGFNRTIASISIILLSGNALVPTADRACFPL